MDGMAGLEDAAPSETEQPMTEDGTPETTESISIPRAALGSRDVKEGDTIRMKVTAVTDDGVQAEVADDKETGKAEGEYQEPNAAMDKMPSAY